METHLPPTLPIASGSLPLHADGAASIVAPVVGPVATPVANPGIGPGIEPSIAPAYQPGISGRLPSNGHSEFAPAAIPAANDSFPGMDAMAGEPSEFHSVEAVVEHCTAPRPSHRLNWDYTLQSLRTGLPLLAIDMAMTTLSLLVAGFLVNYSQGYGLHSRLYPQIPAWLIFQWGLMSLHQLYPGAGVAAVSELRGIARSAAMTCLCLSSMNMIFGQLPRIEFAIFVVSAGFVVMLLPVSRHIARVLLAKTSWWGIRTLLIGTRSQCQKLCEMIQSRRESGLVIAGYVCNHQEYLEASDDDPNMLGAGFDAQRVACDHHAPVAALASQEAEHLAPRLVFQFPSLIWLDQSAVMQETSDPIGAFNRRLNVPFLRFTPRLLKRALDLAIVIPGLIVLAIPMAVIALLIKFYSPGPIIYGSSRVGQHGRRFKMWKFRSMVPNADEVLQKRLDSDPAARAEWDKDQKLKNDPRIIPGVGRIMRSCSLDELPQLWNVLMGQMSLVGPRPVPPGEIVKYQNHYYQYSQMWPGITGLWQVSGRNDTSFETRVFLVHHYAANWSLWLDAWILVKTPMTVITRKGAY
ncbi:exopolysaccharide biosynthesis polyprenyl glycosylphosphotransferase [Rubripirellula amarantea]|uniref:UDP-glucose:undecaprenyl-phosphate glucose-1-phosphate transferase n=1 Tax=Rubripirellula amarantea TaxID=2527999 RepID=A0A5C5WME5_9BACT|nr:exopolysaccharide biosynthesis polyprenyl glycosylphosphotransferase [Rubripirellula amarantea]MDA8743351.1 exopolysaccharide biosynthesis polyprenyl glycosylphosphotransferase [Rubripirellula amarantea]TWT51355.1 UDP-glucose:undecaprenyl-phosphate glucose-1-phosphate transferase [Rubripirellula amarantea]